MGAGIAQRRPRIMKQSQKKYGAVTVEFAIAMPILILFTFTGIEFARVNMLRNTAANAAYEGARKGIVPGATAAECEAAAQGLLDTLGVTGHTVTATPNPIQPDTAAVSVAVSIPITQENSFVTPKFYMGRSLNTSITLPRERTFSSGG